MNEEPFYPKSIRRKRLPVFHVARRLFPASKEIQTLKTAVLDPTTRNTLRESPQQPLETVPTRSKELAPPKKKWQPSWKDPSTVVGKDGIAASSKNPDGQLLPSPQTSILDIATLPKVWRTPDSTKPDIAMDPTVMTHFIGGSETIGIANTTAASAAAVDGTI